VRKHPLTLKAKDRKPPALGSKVRVEAARASPATDPGELLPIINGCGLGDPDKDGLKEHDTAPSGLWLGRWATNLVLEFDLPEPVPLATIEVWNYNVEFQASNGVRQADIAVSPDGTSWQTVVRGAQFPRAEATEDYDEPILLRLDGVTARKVRFENLVPRGTSGQIGLSEIVFHETAGSRAGPLNPEDGATGVGLKKTTLQWAPGQGREHRVYLGTDPAALALLDTTRKTTLDAPELKPGTAYFWRVDEVAAGDRVVAGRVARFETVGLAAWWKFDETAGAEAADATGHRNLARVQGPLRWTPGQGRFGGALEFDGKETLVVCSNAAAFDFHDGMTLSAWIKVRQFEKPAQVLASKGYGGWRLARRGEEGRLEFTLPGPETKQKVKGRPSAAVVASKRAVDDGQWHHLVALYDGQQVAFYLDGELEDSLAVSGEIARNTAPVVLGEKRSRLRCSFNGWMDDVRLYGYGLSPREIQALHRGGAEAARASR